LIRARLHALADFLEERSPGAKTRGVVDTAPLLEREFAQLAGLGWIGKNTLLLNQSAGSYFFLAAILTDIELTYDEAHATDHCGSCTACLDACPTEAFPEAYVLDASRCISYLTIEHRGPIPNELREGVGDWLFGCDVCQDVCPWNRGKTTHPLLELRPIESLDPADCITLFDLSEDEFRQRFHETPLWRAHRRGLLRNAAIVLGNRSDRTATNTLAKGLNDHEALVRGASAWALGRLNSDEARRFLLERTAVEPDPSVQVEIEAALQAC
jgi:epoxyqueuosine reductase